MPSIDPRNLITSKLQSIRRLIAGTGKATTEPLTGEDETVVQHRFHSLLDQFMAQQDRLGVQSRSNQLQANNNNSSQTGTHDVMPEEMAQQIEEFLMDLSGCYQVYGCPTHLIEVNMPKVARGLGMEVDFAVFPTHTLISITRQKTDGSKRKITQYFNTSSGLNMYKLQLVDELVRRIASYATREAPKTASRSVGQPSDIKLLQPSSPGFPRQKRNSSFLPKTTSNNTEDATIPPTIAPSPSVITESAVKEQDAAVKTAPLSVNSSTADLIIASNNNSTTESGKDSTAAITTANQVRIQIDDCSSVLNQGVDKSIRDEILELSSLGPGFFHLHQDLILQTSPPSPASVASNPVPVNGEFVNPLRDGQNRSLTSRSAPTAGTNVTGTTTDKKHQQQQLSTKPLKESNASAAAHGSGRQRKQRYAFAFSKIAVEDGIKRLQQICRSDHLYPVWVNILLSAVASAGCAGLFFKGNWWDVLVGLFMGLIVAVLGLNGSNAHFSRVYQFLASFIVSISVRLINRYIVALCYRAVTLSAIIWLLQGVTLTLSIIELLTRKIVSGTVRLFYGLLISALIGFGLDMGTEVYARLHGIPKSQALLETACSASRPIGPNWYPLFLPLTSLSFNMLINAHPKQLLPMTAVASLAFITYYYIDPVLDSNAASVLAAFVAGVSANIYSSRTGHPSIIYVLAGLLLLVPGSVAVTGFTMIMQNDLTSGVGLAMAVMTTAMALAVGIFTASLLVSLDETKQWIARADGRRWQGTFDRRSQLRF